MLLIILTTVVVMLTSRMMWTRHQPNETEILARAVREVRVTGATIMLAYVVGLVLARLF